MPYTTKSTKPELIDAITNLIDEGIRKQRFGTYEEWQAAVESLLTAHEPRPPYQRQDRTGLENWEDRPDLGTGGVFKT